MSDMELNQETVRALLDAFDRSDWQEMVVTIGGDSLHISRDGTMTAPQASPAPPAAGASSVPEASPAPPAAGASSAPPPPASPPAAADNGAAVATGAAAAAVGTATAELTGTAVTSPSVGLFWHAPAPGEPPFVQVGAPVNAGDTIGIVEVMKLMNHVSAPADGIVTAVVVGNGEPVEFGQPLVYVSSGS